MNDSKALTEIWSIRDKLYEETKNLTAIERQAKLRTETKNAIELIRKKRAGNLLSKNK
jgi:hypothetical protein